MNANSLKVKLWRRKNPDKVRAMRARHYQKHKQKVQARAAGWRKSNVEKRRLQSAAWKKKNPGKVKASLFKTRYGVSFEVFETLFEAQKGRCAICKTGPAEHTDHDHESGNIRGLLCSRCNLALGLFRDSQLVLKSALTYLSICPTK